MERKGHSEDKSDQVTEQAGDSQVPVDGEVWSEVETESTKRSVDTDLWFTYYCDGFSYSFFS